MTKHTKINIVTTQFGAKAILYGTAFFREI